MAIYSAAKQRIIPPGANDPRISPRLGILHVDANNKETLFPYFDGPSGGIESHFHIPKFKQIEQYRDTAWEADANHLANPFAMSVETQGFADGLWNDKQLDDIKDLMLWAEEVHDIPLKKATEWDGEGWGYHILFGAPGKWTPHAKSCPGPLRIEQFNDLLVPWMKEQNDMFTEKDRQLLNSINTRLSQVEIDIKAQSKKSFVRFRTLKNLIVPKS